MLNRRRILQILGAGTFARAARALNPPPPLAHRVLGRTGRWVTTFGLGGQASLQFPAPDLDAPGIVARAIELGVNFLDTARGYGPSESLFGQAFWRLKITPGHPQYDAARRESLFIATKTHQRFALDRARPAAATAVSDLLRSLTLMFGDGRAWIPDGAYVDLVQIHNLTTLAGVSQVYEGLAERGGRMPDRIGALAALLDFRDGTDHTGLNPGHRRYIRHLGISGHLSSPALMEAIRRDDLNILDTLQVAINANDRHYSSHQFNVLPLALARGMGVIAIKVFSAGGIYTGMQRQPNNPAELILSVGMPGGVPSEDLIRYPLSVPGVSTVIAGIGRIDRERPEHDQIAANLAAAQMDMASPAERNRIETRVAERHGTDTNYFQERQPGLVQPTGVSVTRDGDRVVVSWNTALAGPDPVRSYNVFGGEWRLASLPYRPQMSRAPLSVTLPAAWVGDAPVRVEASTSPPPW
jgi:aryl-alcohol dehydrogenase-like predicted oxidoreductase